MNAIEQGRADLYAALVFGDDAFRPVIPELKAAYDYEPKPGDAQSPYLSIWQNGATDDGQHLRFQIRLYVDMAQSARDGQRLFDALCLEVGKTIENQSAFWTTGWVTEWNGDALLAVWDILIGRTDVQ